MSVITVSEEPLRQVLMAFQGPQHHLLELWALRGMPDMPVSQLCREVNEGGIKAPEPEPRMSRDETALVNPAYKWHKITPDTPRKAKVLLINKQAGVLTTGAIGSWPTWFTHYCELPVFDKDEHDEHDTQQAA
jgi:hypothetical protein